MNVRAKWLGIMVMVLLFAGVIYLSVIFSEKGADQTYLLPNGFTGCVVINYDVEGAAPLTVEDDEMVYEVPEDGIINTSSPMELGWASKERSGPYQLKAFYVDQGGNIVRELPQEEIRFGATGATQRDGEKEQRYHYQIFGTEATEAKGCPEVENSR